MRSLVRSTLYLFLFCLCLLNRLLAQELQFADIGDFKLQSGEFIRDCRIGFRTLGTLNSDKSNVILFPTWASGTSEQLISNIGQGKLIDSSKYYVILVDALSNGVSSSPSNSKLQPRMNFPKVTITDMVNSQYMLLTRILKLNHIKAVVGISMGGMQTFQWMVSYPEFMDIAIPIVGSPRLTPYDLVLQSTIMRSIMTDPKWNNGSYTENPARVSEAEFYALILTTPEDLNKSRSRENILAEIEKAKDTKGFDSNDKIRQIQAMMSLNVSEHFNGSMEKAAGAVKAKVLVIAATRDHIVYPGPALEFARLLKAPAIELDSDCGHLSPGCESKRVNQAVADFLEQ